jgi:hypothetical protein
MSALPDPPNYGLRWWARWGLFMAWHRYLCRYCRNYTRAYDKAHR